MNNLEVLRRMFDPSSIAVIGASREPGKVGYSVVKNIIDGGYRGEVYPVNPRADEILGLKCYHNVKEIPGTVDVAIMSVPAAIVPRLMADLGEKGVPVAVVVSSGFAEMGNVELHEKLIDAARMAGVRILGPNIFGYYYTPRDLCATFCIPYTKRGGIALTCQSGGVGMAVIGFTRSRGIGVSAIVGLGNKADIDEGDLLEFFAQDENTDVVAMHMEDLKDGRRFLEIAKKVTKVKPIVVFKVGRTERGARAAASHTAALAGDDHLYEAAFRQSGIVRARTLEELFDWARVLTILPPPKGENLLIHTGAGGLGVILSDACYDHDLKLMEMPQDLEQELRRYIPPFGSFKNPVDITGASPPDTYSETARILLKDPRVHSIIFGYWHTIITPPMTFARVIADVVEEARGERMVKPVVASLSGDVEVEEAARYLEERGIPSYPYAPERAVAALAAVYQWSRHAGLVEQR
ncbi:MAG: acetate--CoA ligase family protein [Candidatus Bathyarchaeia archaeon]